MKIAVIIPALDESAGVAGAIESAHAPNVDVLVVDGGSSDETWSVATAAGARVISSAPGRGRQLQAGVAATTGDVVVFLHADTRLPPDWEREVRRAVERPGCVGGAFRLRFDSPALRMRIIEWLVHVRVALFALPYGDQAIFVRRSVLDATGGVPDVPIMEDLDLVRAMKNHGQVVSVALPALTSARRYIESGVWKTVARNAIAILGWTIGVDRRRVAGWLRG